MLKKVMLIALALCLILCGGGCRPEKPQLDVTDGFYDQERAAKIVNLKEGDRAYYTVDGSEPGTESIAYNSEEGIPLSEGENHLKVVTVNPAGKVSKVLTATIVIGPQTPQLVTPEGVYSEVFAAKLVNLKEGYDAYYTLDGLEPNTYSSPYTDAGIPLSEGDNLVKVIKYDEAGNSSDVLAATIVIQPEQPDYSNSFTRLHKEGNYLYYVQSMIGPMSPYSPFPEYSKLYRYDLANGTREVVVNKDMNQFLIRDGIVYYEYESITDEAEQYLWCSYDLNDGRHWVLFDSLTENSRDTNYRFTNMMLDDSIYYQSTLEGVWHLFRLNVNTLEGEAVSEGQTLFPVAMVDRDIFFQGNGKLHKFNVDSGEKILISYDAGSKYKVFGSFIYYYMEDPYSQVYRMNLDGSDKQQVPYVASSEFVVVGDKIYYASSQGLFGMRIDGADNEKIYDIVPKNLQYYQGRLFFNEEIPSSGACNLYCLNVSTKEAAVIFEGKEAGYLYFVDGETYFVYSRVIEGEAGLYQLTDTGLVKLTGDLR